MKSQFKPFYELTNIHLGLQTRKHHADRFEKEFVDKARTLTAEMIQDPEYIEDALAVVEPADCVKIAEAAIEIVDVHARALPGKLSALGVPVFDWIHKYLYIEAVKEVAKTDELYRDIQTEIVELYAIKS
tara:strand:+ start:61 stop:450 length:390 start_codon:yes stop_codon:yes gene_type:complete